MNGALVAALNRIACATGALRVRADDVTRVERNGSPGEIRARVDELVTRLERIADQLEDALA